MTDRERIAHLYRRFGLGASPAEVEAALPNGVEGTIRRLIELPVPYEFPVGPYEFVWYAQVDPDLAGEYFRRWWLLKMLTTTDPLQERMALFWHSHFAASNAKVEFGPMMLDYLLAIQQNSLGTFRSLLGAVVKTPAMLEYLDMGRSLKGHPNENLARELMELYTLGEGNYTEQDVHEASRALTGWGYVNTFFDLPGTNATRARDSIRDERPFAAFTWMPAMHDAREKEILGQKGRFNGEDLLDILAKHPQTARHLATKLWTYFASPDPEPEVVDKIAETFASSGGDIRRTLAAIARHEAFWSEEHFRQRVKSPIDYTIGILRAVGVGDALMAYRSTPADHGAPLSPYIQNELYNLLGSLDRQGLALLRPPNPSGWKEGTAWVHSAAVGERMMLRIPFAAAEPGANFCLRRAQAFVLAGKPKTPADVLNRLCLLFDWAPSDNTREIMLKPWEERGVASLKYLPDFGVRFHKTLQLAGAAPEMHFC